MLELQQVPRRVEQHERVVLLHQALEPGADLLVERDLAENRARVQRLDVPYSKAASVSARSPRRRVSSPITPGAGTFPRFTSGPSLVTKYACSVVEGASNSSLSWLSPEASTSSTSPNRSAPSGRQIPDR